MSMHERFWESVYCDTEFQDTDQDITLTLQIEQEDIPHNNEHRYVLTLKIGGVYLNTINEGYREQLSDPRVPKRDAQFQIALDDARRECSKIRYELDPEYRSERDAVAKPYKEISGIKSPAGWRGETEQKR